MKLTVNGNPTEIPDKLSISELLTLKEVESPEMVSVQLNGTILDRTEFGTTQLGEGDTVEFLYFMGGGA